MKCLVVITHPLRDSLCSFLGEHIVAQLKEPGHEVAVENLYESGFKPALSKSERSSYYSESYDASGVEEQALKLKEAEAIVLVYPTWWLRHSGRLGGLIV